MTAMETKKTENRTKVFTKLESIRENKPVFSEVTVEKAEEEYEDTYEEEPIPEYMPLDWTDEHNAPHGIYQRMFVATDDNFKYMVMRNPISYKYNPNGWRYSLFIETTFMGDNHDTQLKPMLFNSLNELNKAANGFSKLHWCKEYVNFIQDRKNDNIRFYEDWEIERMGTKKWNAMKLASLGLK